ncbi:DUF2382 domain-containing protein [Arthrobacter monumenti]
MISIGEIDNLLKNSGIILDQNGDKVGKVGQVFVGDDSQQPEWVTAKTGLFGHSETFIPLREASAEGNDVRVPYERDKIKDAPRTDLAHGHLEREQEADLYRYYGLEPERGGAHVGDGHGGQGVRQEPVREDAGDGSYGGGYDQDLKHDDTSDGRNAEGVRLRKYTVTEHVTMTVPVQREEVEVVPDPESGGAAESQRDRAAQRETATAAPESYPADQAGSGPRPTTAGAAPQVSGAPAAGDDGGRGDASGPEAAGRADERHRHRAGDDQRSKDQ